MLQLLDAFKRGKSYDDALLEVYGFNTDGLDDAWHASLGLVDRIKAMEQMFLMFLHPLSTSISPHEFSHLLLTLHPPRP